MGEMKEGMQKVLKQCSKQPSEDCTSMVGVCVDAPCEEAQRCFGELVQKCGHVESMRSLVMKAMETRSDCNPGTDEGGMTSDAPMMGTTDAGMEDGMMTDGDMGEMTSQAPEAEPGKEDEANDDDDDNNEDDNEEEEEVDVGASKGGGGGATALAGCLLSLLLPLLPVLAWR